jgi:GMP synthase (glutamine-hydrolysing)
MGGPMSVHDSARFPWLTEEKRLIEAAMQAEKRVLGVCLGAQLIADVLGARVYKNRFQEIGWFPVHSTEVGRAQWNLPREFPVFHWHGDTFDLPKAAVHLAKSAACEQQMFVLGDKVLGIQFHAEVTRAGIEDFVRHGSSELGEGPYVQSVSTMGGIDGDIVSAHTLLDVILDRWSA